MLAVIASRKELQMDSEGATDLGVTAVQSLICAAAKPKKQAHSLPFRTFPGAIGCRVREMGIESFPVPTNVAPLRTSSPAESANDR
jgi:hypothetical protein